MDVVKLYSLELHRTYGHTLIELLIAMTLSLFMMAGVIQVFSSSSRTFYSVSEQLLMQENGRFAIEFIERQVRRAGFIENINFSKNSSVSQKMNDIFPEVESIDSNGVGFQKGAVVAGLNDANIRDIKEGSDILHIRYQRSERIVFRDCLNTRLDERYADVIITFFVSEDNKLRCRGVRTVRGSRELIEGVEDMQVLYGVDIDGDDALRAERYVNAGDMEDKDWRNIVSVKIAILASSGSSESNTTTNEEKEYKLLDEIRTFDDGRMRGVFTQMMQFRNINL